MAYVTLAELRSYIGIDDARDDVRLQTALAAAEARVARHCGRDFNVAGVTATARKFTALSAYRCLIDDATEITEVAYDTTGGGTFTAWTSTQWLAEPVNGVRAGLSGWPFDQIVAVYQYRFPTAPARVRVTAKWGWAAVPAEVTQATLILAHRMWRRVDAPEGVLGFGGDGVVVNLRQTDPDVAALLEPFTRFLVA